MIIRKLFKFEGAHIVRNCSSTRCKKSIHGHSYVVEVFFTSDGLDNGQMVVDFGLMKSNIKDFIDGFDHAYSMWDKEADEFKDFMKSHSERWVEMPVSPSAEAYAIMFFKVIDAMLHATEFHNGEKNPRLHSVRVHETATGYAEAFREDTDWADFAISSIKLSDGVKAEWKDPDMFDKLCKVAWTHHKIFINPVVDQQI